MLGGKESKKSKQRQFVNKEVQELEDEAISGEKLFGEPMDKPPLLPILITPIPAVPTHAHPSGHTGTRKAVGHFRKFAARKPIRGASRSKNEMNPKREWCQMGWIN